MEYEKLRNLHELLPLLERLDQGEEPTPEEQAELEAVVGIISDVQADHLPGSMSKLKNLAFLACNITPFRDLSPLRELQNLQKMYLYRIDGTDLSVLAELRNLRELRLAGKVRILPPLEELHSLQSLDLFGTQISDLTPLEGLKNLRSLDLFGRRIRDLKPLEGLKNLQSLELSSTLISDLKPLEGLCNLQSLHLSWTQVDDLKPLEELRNLQSLNLSGTQITDLKPLEGLHNLQSLNLSGTLITDLKSLKELRNLHSLDLTHTRVRDLKPLEGLRNLQSLNLLMSPISDLKPLEELRNLQSLNLDGTHVSDLKPLERLRNLQTLKLEGTRVTDLAPLENLTALKQLDLDCLDLKAIPRALFDLELPFTRNSDENYISLFGATLSTQPVSLFYQNRSVIRAYYDAEKVDVREAKVIFLGDGGAGKTHTIKRILNEDKDENIDTRTTLGISITPYRAAGKGGPFRINFWDFGGQENMHAMHRCFLTERTCYVVVISNRWNLDTQARYWLDNIHSFAPKAPVILAVNKWEGIPACPMDTNRLYQDYPNLKEVTHYTAKGGDPEDFTSQLTKFIVRHAETLDSNAMQLPKDWAAIRQDLVDMADSSKWYINQDDYYNICKKHGLGNDEDAPIRTWLLDWFNDLGICFSHHQKQSAYNVLNPRWLTSAIYILLNSADKIDSNGKVLHSMIERILRAPCEDDLARRDNCDYVLPDVQYSKAECQFILAVMRKFGLSYQVSANEEFIPALCGSEMPKELHPAEYRARISYEFRYGFLPDSLVQRLMVRLCPRPYTALWRRGFRFDETDLTAVVDAGGPDDTLRIDIFTQASRSGRPVLMMLVALIRELQEAMGMRAEEFIVVRGPRGEIPVPADMVLLAWEQKIPQLHLYSKENGIIAESPGKILGEAYAPEILDEAEKLVRQEKCSAPEAAAKVIHNHFHGNVKIIKGNVINGDNIEGNKYTQVIPENLIAVLDKLIQENCQTNRDFIDHLLAQLEASGDNAAREIAREANTAPEKKRNLLSTLRKTAGTVGCVTSFLADSDEAGKTLLAIAGAVSTAAKVCGPVIAEFIANLPPMML